MLVVLLEDSLECLVNFHAWLGFVSTVTAQTLMGQGCNNWNVVP